MLLEVQFPFRQALNLVQKEIPAPRAAWLRADVSHDLFKHGSPKIGRAVHLRIV